jgi:hypothetical protein
MADESSGWYDTFLTVSTVIFSVEYALRLWSCVEDERFTHPIIGRCEWLIDCMLCVAFANISQLTVLHCVFWLLWQTDVDDPPDVGH